MPDTGFIYHPDYLQHDTGEGHPECSERLLSIMSRLEESGLINKLIRLEPRPASEEEILLVHSRRHLDLIRDAWKKGFRALNPDTPISERSYETALLAAGGVLEGIDGIMEGKIDNGMALVRPPGHHATGEHGMGFCLFNNVAVGAGYLQKKYRIERVLIVDWDVHHGNGTQEIFYEDPSVLYFSTHEYPHYPGTGSIHETGSGPGKGYTINVPVRSGISSGEFMKRFRDGLYDRALEFKPQFVLISAGFDAHRNDPLGGLLLTEDDYAAMTAIVLDIAAKSCEGKVLSTLEGGYDLAALASSVEAHLRAMSA